MDEIKHSGIVTKINPGLLTITLQSQSACMSCHARGFCSAAEMKDKEIEVTHFSQNYTPGQQVTVVLRGSLGIKAVLYGYGFPFVIVMMSLVLIISLTGNETLAGFVSLAMLVPYFAGLYLSRNRLKRTFSFEIEET